MKKYKELMFEPVFYKSSVLEDIARVAHFRNKRLYVCQHLDCIKDKHSKFVIWNATDFHYESVKINNINFYNKQEKNKLATVTEEDKIKYIKKTIQASLNIHNIPYQAPVDEKDILYLARKKIKKDDPAVLKYFDEQYQDIDKRGVVEGIEKFLRFCVNNPEGKNLTDVYNRAYTFLKRFGYTKLSGFQEAWELLTNLYQLNDNDAMTNISVG